jgi:hypothetical protein
MNNTTQSANQGTQSQNQILLIVIPNMVTGDATTVANVTTAFNQVGALHPVTNGVFYIQTDKVITSWGEQVRSALGADLQIFMFPVNSFNLNMYRTYLPQDMQQNVQGIRAA